MTIQVLEPHGFCAGVTGALHKALALADSVPPGTALYCLHELVHNERVVADLAKRGFIFVESIEEVPVGATVLFSAHGVSPDVRRRAAERQLTVADATCPFVARVHQAAVDYAARGFHVVILGHPNHVEVKGILGEVPQATVLESLAAAEAFSPPDSTITLGVVSQTTLNADEVAQIVGQLRARFTVETLAQVCHATKERQDAVKAFEGDALLVLGSSHSSNTQRLCEVAHCRTFRAGTLAEVQSLDLTNINTLGITSGASTPESILINVIRHLQVSHRP